MSADEFMIDGNGMPVEKMLRLAFEEVLTRALAEINRDGEPRPFIAYAEGRLSDGRPISLLIQSTGRELQH